MSEPHGKPGNPRLRTYHISQGKFIHSPDRSSCRFAPASDEIRMSRTEKGSGEGSTKSSVLKCFTLAPRMWKSDLASQRGKEIEVHGPLAQAKRSNSAHMIS